MTPEQLQLQTNKFYNHFRNKYGSSLEFDKLKTGHLLIQSVLEIYKNNLNNKETLQQIMNILDEKLKPIPLPAPPFIEETKLSTYQISIPNQNQNQNQLPLQQPINQPLQQNTNTNTNTKEQIDFPLRFRDTQLKNIQSQQHPTSHQPTQEYFISLDSKDRDRTIYTAPNSWTTNLTTLFQREISNIKEFQLISCILLNIEELNTIPYLMLEIEELGSLYVGSNPELMKAFNILTDYEIKGDYRYYKIDKQQPSKHFSTPTMISKLTIKLKSPDGSLIDFGEKAQSMNSTVINLIFRINCLSVVGY